MRAIHPASSTDAQLKGLIVTLEQLRYKVGIEIAGARVRAILSLLLLLLHLPTCLRVCGRANMVCVLASQWGNWSDSTQGVCSEADMIQGVAAAEQKQVARWLKLGGTIDSVTTDHAMTWDVRGPGPGDGYAPACLPAVPMTTRIDTLARVFASWRAFLGPKASLGFIESLGYWDIDGPDGTNCPRRPGVVKRP